MLLYECDFRYNENQLWSFILMRKKFYKKSYITKTIYTYKFIERMCVPILLEKEISENSQR